MRMVRLFLLFLVSLAVSVSAGSVVPYNDPACINGQRYQFSSEDRLIGDAKATPEWPYYARLFRTSSHARSELFLSSARDGFSLTGDLGNSAVVWFKKNPLQLQDICAFAALVASNHAIYTVDRKSNPLDETPAIAFASTADNYLRYLAGHDLLFDASTQKQQLNFKYARSCWNDLFYIGFELGLVRASQNLAMKSALTAAEAVIFTSKYDNTKSTDAGKPLKVFPDGLMSVFNELLAEKNLSSDLNDEAIMVGDTKFFINIPLRLQTIPAASFSVYVSVPSPQHYNTAKVIQAFAGEPFGGLSLGVATGFCWNSTSLLNLHFFSYGQYTLPRIVSRRVPRLLTRSVSSDPVPIVTGSETEPTLPLSVGAVHYRAYSVFSLPDSFINDFSDSTRSINMRKGPEFGVQIGNTCESLLFKNLQLDVSYKFKFKANDVLGTSNLDSGYYRDQVVANSFNMSHVISAAMNYEYSDSLGFVAGLNYTIAGRGVLKEVSGCVGMTGIF